MNPVTTSAFDLPERLHAKADPALIAGDERHFAAIAASLDAAIAELTDASTSPAERRQRSQPGRRGQAALDRDQEVHRLTARLRVLRRFGLDLCLGHIVAEDDAEPVYIGRLGLTDSAGRRLLLDWRSPAAAPFFGATIAEPDGPGQPPPLSLDRAAGSATTGTRCSPPTGWTGTAASLDDQSAFIASLGSRPLRPDARRPRDDRGRPGRDHPGRIARRARGRRRSGHGQDRRRAAPGRPTCSTPIRGSGAAQRRGAVHRTASALPGLRRRRACRASARTACRPPPCAIWSPRARSAATEPDPDGRAAEVVRPTGRARSRRPCGSTRSRPPDR